MTIQSHVFQSESMSWEDMSAEAAEFATKIGRDNLISISIAAAGGSAFAGYGATGIIIVWYWDNQR